LSKGRARQNTGAALPMEEGSPPKKLSPSDIHQKFLGTRGEKARGTIMGLEPEGKAESRKTRNRGN